MGNLVFDCGNFEWKWLNPDTRQQGALTNAVAPLSMREWKELVGIGLPPEGLIKVNGEPFAMGTAAFRHTIAERPKGPARYVMGYFGASLAYTMTQAFDANDTQITLAASHPPGDAGYAPLIEEVACRDWYIETSKGTRQFSIVDFMPYDEPMGGFANLAFNLDGSENRRYRHKDKIALLLDFGGHTVDWMPIDPNGRVDYVAADSSKGAGTLAVMNKFGKDLKDLYRDLVIFREIERFDMRKLEAAMKTGVFTISKTSYPCEEIAAAAINTLVNDARQVINAAGGLANYDVILLTGGGSALIYDALKLAMPDMEFVLTADISLMRFANVLGGAKLLKMYQS